MMEWRTRAAFFPAKCFENLAFKFGALIGDERE